MNELTHNSPDRPTETARERAERRHAEGRARLLALARATRESTLTLEQRRRNAYR